ncbi:alpha/beta hydrolase [Porticoccaceae bacterium]|nr:alpha/beta hydrolase [Porticoccaceae bacterium]
MVVKYCVGILLSIMWVHSANSAETKRPTVDPDGTVHIDAFTLPESSFLSKETRRVLKLQREVGIKEWEAMDCPEFEAAKMADMPVIRQCRADFFYTTSMYKNMVKRYAVKMSPKTIGGVYTEIFTPSEGIREGNRGKVLINVHGGGFQYGSRSTSHLESIPIAAVGQIKVISIDYRMAPEYQFPAASEDVEKVYRELLKEYSAENIGLYGCSAGGMLTAQSVAWFLDKELPLPGAVGMFCWGAGTERDLKTDGGKFSGALGGIDWEDFLPNPYLKNAKGDDPLTYPGDFSGVLTEFPPSLLITATRDMALSSVIQTHINLKKLGVEADLFVWEGLGHAFHFNSEIPESREAYDVIVEFFDSHLGK